jgi:hypothetical protein
MPKRWRTTRSPPFSITSGRTESPHHPDSLHLVIRPPGLAGVRAKRVFITPESQFLRDMALRKFIGL